MHKRLHNHHCLLFQLPQQQRLLHCLLLILVLRLLYLVNLCPCSTNCFLFCYFLWYSSYSFSFGNTFCFTAKATKTIEWWRRKQVQPSGLRKVYTCKVCGQAMTSAGHTQYQGKWYCPHPSEQISKDQWLPEWRAEPSYSRECYKSMRLSRDDGEEQKLLM